MATVSHSTNLRTRSRDQNQAKSDRYSPIEMITLVIGFSMIMIAFAGIFNGIFWVLT